MSWSIETARQSDIPGIRELAKQSKFTSGFDRMRFLLKEREVLIVALNSDSEVVGFCQGVHLSRRKYSSIYNFATRPDYKRQGIGKAMVNEMLERSPHRTIRLVVDHRNREGYAFYLRQGFHEIEYKRSRAGDNLIVLELIG